MPPFVVGHCSHVGGILAKLEVKDKKQTKTRGPISVPVQNTKRSDAVANCFFPGAHIIFLAMPSACPEQSARCTGGWRGAHKMRGSFR